MEVDTMERIHRAISRGAQFHSAYPEINDDTSEARSLLEHEGILVGSDGTVTESRPKRAGALAAQHEL